MVKQEYHEVLLSFGHEINELPCLDYLRALKTKKWWELTDFITLQESLFWVSFREEPLVRNPDTRSPAQRFALRDREFSFFGKKYSYKIGKKIYKVEHVYPNELLYHTDDYDSWSKIYKKWQQKVESNLHLYKTDLYLKLAKKELIAYGANAPYFDSFASKYGALEQTIYPYKTIPQSEWIFDKIDWGKSYLQSQNFEFFEIFLRPKDLLNIYPAPSWYSEKIETFGEDRLIMENLEKRGRKRTNYWDAFHAEVAKYILEKGKLPSQQSELIRHCQRWFLDTFGEEPAESEIKEKISLYYKTLGT